MHHTQGVHKFPAVFKAGRSFKDFVMYIPKIKGYFRLFIGFPTMGFDGSINNFLFFGGLVGILAADYQAKQETLENDLNHICVFVILTLNIC